MNNKEIELLTYLHDRFVNVYNESENVDFLINLRNLIRKYNVFNNQKHGLIVDESKATKTYFLKTIDEFNVYKKLNSKNYDKSR